MLELEAMQDFLLTPHDWAELEPRDRAMMMAFTAMRKLKDVQGE